MSTNSQKQKNNVAYIDGANLHKGIASLGWRLDYSRFRVWLEEKYDVRTAYLFIGLISSFKDLYKYLQESGFILVYKEVIFDGDGKPKGNCDADLVLQVACDTYEGKYEKAVIVSSDGDYAGLVRFLQQKGKMRAVLSPATEKKCSILLKRTNAPIAYLSDQKNKLQVRVKEKAPGGDETPQGPSS